VRKKTRKQEKKLREKVNFLKIFHASDLVCFVLKVFDVYISSCAKMLPLATGHQLEIF
jgi:hypothetical protein